MEVHDLFSHFHQFLLGPRSSYSVLQLLQLMKPRLRLTTNNVPSETSDKIGTTNNDTKPAATPSMNTDTSNKQGTERSGANRPRATCEGRRENKSEAKRQTEGNRPCRLRRRQKAASRLPAGRHRGNLVAHFFLWYIPRDAP